RCRVLSLVLCLMWLSFPAQAQEAKRTHDITVADYFTQADILESKISPSGNFVAFTQATWQKSTNDRKSDLWMLGARTGKARKLTFDRAGDRSLFWSPDDKSIYFLGNRKRAEEKSPPYDGKAQVWRIPIEGDTPFAVTRVEGGVDQFALASDGQSLYYV